MDRGVNNSFTGVLGTSSKKLVLEIKYVYRNKYCFYLTCVDPYVSCIMFLPGLCIVSHVMLYCNDGFATPPPKTYVADINETLYIDDRKYHLYKEDGNIYIQSDDSFYGTALRLNKEISLHYVPFTSNVDRGYYIYGILRLINV